MYITKKKYIIHSKVNYKHGRQAEPYESYKLHVFVIFRLHLRDVCVYCLLYTDSGRALLDILATGVDTVEIALALQGRYVHYLILSFAIILKCKTYLYLFFY